MWPWPGRLLAESQAIFARRRRLAALLQARHTAILNFAAQSGSSFYNIHAHTLKIKNWNLLLA
jgi:hypothetical protein